MKASDRRKCDIKGRFAFESRQKSSVWIGHIRAWLSFVDFWKRKKHLAGYWFLTMSIQVEGVANGARSFANACKCTRNLEPFNWIHPSQDSIDAKTSPLNWFNLNSKRNKRECGIQTRDIILLYSNFWILVGLIEMVTILHSNHILCNYARNRIVAEICGLISAHFHMQTIYRWFSIHFYLCRAFQMQFSKRNP